MDAKVVHVEMAGMRVVRDGYQLKAVLGSCVGVIVRDPQRKVCGLAHVMMPRCRDGDPSRGKYADTAVADLIEQVTPRGCGTAGLEAVLVGGARMFPGGNEGIAPVGDLNVAATRRALQKGKVRITYEDTGGTHGRAILFDNTTGEITIRTLQRPGEVQGAPDTERLRTARHPKDGALRRPKDGGMPRLGARPRPIPRGSALHRPEPRIQGA